MGVQMQPLSLNYAVKIFTLAKEKRPKEINTHPNRIGIKEAAGYTIAEAGNMFNLTYISG